MATLKAVERRMATTEQLQSVVKTMKALAGVNIRQFEQAAESLREYYAVIESGLQIVLRDGRAGMVVGSVEPRQVLGLIVIGSDQGMCGRFNEVIGNRALEAIEQRAGAGKFRPATIAVGARVAGVLEDGGQQLSRTLWAPSSLHEVTTRVQELVLEVDTWRAQERGGIVLLCYNRHEGASYQTSVQQLLPLDPEWLRQLANRSWASRCVPAFTMSPERILAALIRRYLFASLHRALAESLAAENAARLQTMQAAEDNIQDQLEELNLLYNGQRQSAIDEELLDIVAGFEALESDSD